jgi:O-antigen ligase
MKESVQKRIVSLGIFSGVSGTLAVTPFTNWDPINLGKVLAISACAFAIGFLLFSNFNKDTSRIFSWHDAVFFSFVVALFIPIFFARAPISQQIWGVMGRNTGFLTYFSLTLICWGISKVALRNLEEKVIKWLLATGVVSLLYGIVQSLGLDPVAWSQKSVFGTLGNVNFFAAFLAIVTVAALALCLTDHSMSISKRLSYFVLAISLTALNVRTDSMQGPVTTGVGLLTIFLIIAYQRKYLSKAPNLLILLSAILALIFMSILGLMNKGPLGTTLFQDSNVFRKDYMLAGLRMTLHNPFTGVGLDSYDNWYRAERGFVAAYRTGVNRTSNSAHNIFLDISAGGGFILLIAYLGIVFYAFKLSLRVLRRENKVQSYYIAAFSAWLSYQFQSLLSINQIGVGIWGWILTGTLIAASKRYLEKGLITAKEKNHGKSKFQNRVSEMPPLSAILAIIGFCFGFTFAFLPFSADASFRKAMDTQNLQAMNDATNRIGANAFLISKALNSAIASQNIELSKSLTEKLTQKYPQEIYGWDVKARSSIFEPMDRRFAAEKVKQIDPNLVCLEPNPSASFVERFGKLPIEEKGELLGWWGLVPRTGATEVDIRSAELSPSFTQRVSSICNS